MSLNGIDYLRKKLSKYQRRNEIRQKYYDMKYHERNRSFTMPVQVQNMFKSVSGWSAKAVDELADRLVFREFDNDNHFLNEIFQLNNPDIFFDSAILSALVSSCSFVYISEDEDGFPRLQVIEANDATGIIDPITGLLTEGYAVLARDKSGKPTIEAHFLPGVTIYYEKGMEPYSYENTAPAPLLVPIIHRPDANRPFGRSRISRSVMYWQNYAKRTLERSDVTAEFYSFPQKYVVGTSQESEPLDTWKATMSSLIEITKDADGDVPKFGQFQTSSMQPFIDQYRMAAAGVAGETGLTLDDLGFVSDNPSSSEAIKASHESLRLKARKAQRTFGSGFLNVGYLAACVRDKTEYKRNQFYLTKPKWEPVFEPDASSFSVIGDGVIKINQAIPEFFNKHNLRDLTGIEGGTIENGYVGRVTPVASEVVQGQVLEPPEGG